ncbi:MAG: M50 family metallopeptidase [Chthonomonadales bacterium]|nr:M50 family metallopeptidase [Chthonomonadales bacterium]
MSRTGPHSQSRRMLLATSAASVVFWYIPGAFIVAYPIRLFVTLVHEAGHAMAAVLTGGSVASISIAPTGSGLTETLGGIPLLIYPAGYVGAAAAGAGLLLLSRWRNGRNALVLMAASVLAITLLWVRNPFGFLAGVFIVVAIGALIRWLPAAAADFAASFLAVQLCLNALLDVRSLLWLTTATDVPNDAVFMARMFGLTPWFWAATWSAVTLGILVLALRNYWRPRRA